MPKLPFQTAQDSCIHRLHGFACRYVRLTGLVAILCTGAAAAQGGLPNPHAPALSADSVVSTPVSRQVDLQIDFAVIVQIDGEVSAIVMGNADIADASVVATGILALTGKAVGTTNIVVLGSDGGILSELWIQVGADKPGAVTVRRALQQSIYACTATTCWRSDGGADAEAPR